MDRINERRGADHSGDATEKMENLILLLLGHFDGLSEEELNYLLYLIDFTAYGRTGKSITGLEYERVDMFPNAPEDIPTILESIKSKLKSSRKLIGTCKECKFVDPCTFRRVVSRSYRQEYDDGCIHWEEK